MLWNHSEIQSPEHAFHCSVFNFTPRLSATLGGQSVLPGFGGWGGAAEVFLRLAHGSHPGFEHDPPGAAFRGAHGRTRLDAGFFTERVSAPVPCYRLWLCSGLRLRALFPFPWLLTY